MNYGSAYDIFDRFYYCCVHQLFFGIYALYLNPKSAINRIFLAVALCLSVWALGLSIATSAPELSTCLFWRRVSALGWGVFFSALLHFFIALTHKPAVLKRWWMYVALYLPALMAILAFSIPLGG